jgi:hypothetical protein
MDIHELTPARDQQQRRPIEESRSRVLLVEEALRRVDANNPLLGLSRGSSPPSSMVVFIKSELEIAQKHRKRLESDVAVGRPRRRHLAAGMRTSYA